MAVEQRSSIHDEKLAHQATCQVGEYTRSQLTNCKAKKQANYQKSSTYLSKISKLILLSHYASVCLDFEVD